MSEDFIQKCPILSLVVYYAMLHNDWQDMIALDITYTPQIPSYHNGDNRVNTGFIKFINKEFAGIELTDDEIHTNTRDIKAGIVKRRGVNTVKGANLFYCVDSEIRLYQTVVARALPNITNTATSELYKAVRFNKSEIDKLNLDEKAFRRHFIASKMEYKLMSS